MKYVSDQIPLKLKEKNKDVTTGDPIHLVNREYSVLTKFEITAALNTEKVTLLWNVIPRYYI